MSDEVPANKSVVDIKNYIKPPPKEKDNKDNTDIAFTMILSGLAENREGLDRLIQDLVEDYLEVNLVLIEKDGVVTNINYEADNDIS